MPIEVGVWRLTDDPSPVVFSMIENEQRLEEVLTAKISMLSPDLLLIGRQVHTDYGKFIDLLAMDQEGNLTVIELKRGRTPRDVVAQLLDYATWVQSLSHDQITDIYESYAKKEFEVGFADRFGGNPPEKLNLNHNLLVVSTELDPCSERVISYLSENYSVPINAVFFRYFKDCGNEYITRSWLVEPSAADPTPSPRNAGRVGVTEKWNGQDYYASYGTDASRTWEDARKYGFISAGGGKWYTQTLYNLAPGNRIFVNIPKTGYVGVGLVVDKAVPMRDFKVIVDGIETPIVDATTVGLPPTQHLNNDDMTETYVRVEWIKTVPIEQAYWEKGMFANQASVCKLRNQFTLQKLTYHFGLDQS